MVGGVILLGGMLMEIVLFDDQLLIEVCFSLCDIVFIYLGQEVIVKIMVFELLIYGLLLVKVEWILFDMIEDQVDWCVYYYCVYVFMQYVYLEICDGKWYLILLGMVVIVEICIGCCIVFDYLVKLLNCVVEVLCEC